MFAVLVVEDWLERGGGGRAIATAADVDVAAAAAAAAPLPLLPPELWLLNHHVTSLFFQRSLWRVTGSYDRDRNFLAIYRSVGLC